VVRAIVERAQARGGVRVEGGTEVAVDQEVGPVIEPQIIGGGDEAAFGDPVELLNTVMLGLSPRL
jgi:hypothetical protein